MLNWLPQPYQGFRFWRDSKAHHLDGTVAVVMVKTGAPRPGGDLNRVSVSVKAPRQRY